MRLQSARGAGDAEMRFERKTDHWQERRKINHAQLPQVWCDMIKARRVACGRVFLGKPCDSSSSSNSVLCVPFETTRTNPCPTFSPTPPPPTNALDLWAGQELHRLLVRKLGRLMRRSPGLLHLARAPGSSEAPEAPGGCPGSFVFPSNSQRLPSHQSRGLTPC